MHLFEIYSIIIVRFSQLYSLFSPVYNLIFQKCLLRHKGYRQVWFREYQNQINFLCVLSFRTVFCHSIHNRIIRLQYENLLGNHGNNAINSTE
jgi:hypothetical protein